MNEDNFRFMAKTWIKKHPKLFTIYKQGIFRILTKSIRVLPDFLIIGGVKCGTTSLYDYLIKHPQIYPAKNKEAKFFDFDYELGLSWYRSNFPSSLSKFLITKLFKKRFLTGEATPNYLHHPLCAKRIHDNLPDIKLIIILRNPVERAYSEYQMRIRSGHEVIPFEDTIKQEEEMISKGENLLENNYYAEYGAKFRPYLSRGFYQLQISKWLNLFPRKNFLFLKTEDLDKNPQQILDEVFKFLGLPEFILKNLDKKNVGRYPKLEEKTREHLFNYYKPYNENLIKLLGEHFRWDY